MSTNAPTSPSAALRAKRISARWLSRHGARCEQVDLFSEVFGTGSVPVTPETIRRAARAGLNIDWFARAVATAREVYRRAVAVAREEYDHVVEEAEDVYARACDAAARPFFVACAEALISVVWGSTTPDA